MTPPVLITAPTEPVVALADMKAHLRVDHPDDDALIEALESAAVAHLDGWTGVLGRAIRSQVWRQEFKAGDVLRLALPDVGAITVTAYDADDAEVAVTATLETDYRGAFLDVEGAWETLRVDYTCALPDRRLPAVQAAVKLLVGHWYANREAVAAGAPAPVPMTVDALITALRWTDM